MWYNNYPNGEYILGFVIWKDYNCDRWLSLGDSSYQYSGLSSDQVGQINNAISAITAQWNVNIWIAAANFMESLTSLSDFSGSDKAFSVVMSENYDQTYFYSRLCVKSSNFFYLGVDLLNQPIGVDGGNNNWGNLLLFQTRWSDGEVQKCYLYLGLWRIVRIGNSRSHKELEVFIVRNRLVTKTQGS